MIISTIIFNTPLFCFLQISVIETLQDLKCVEGVSVTLQCLLTGPEHQAKWSKDGKEILFDKEVTRAHLCFLEKDINVQAYKLIFSNIKQAERGTYTLQVGDQRCECFLDITGIFFQFHILYVAFC